MASDPILKLAHSLTTLGPFTRPSVRVSPDWDAGGGVTGGESTHPHPKGPAQRNANILALALPDRPHHGPRYKIFAWRWPPSAGPQPSQRTEPLNVCLCDGNLLSTSLLFV